MSVPELKQARLGKRGRQEIHAHLVCLQHNSPPWKRESARRIRAMQAAHTVTPAELAARC